MKYDMLAGDTASNGVMSISDEMMAVTRPDGADDHEMRQADAMTAFDNALYFTSATLTLISGDGDAARRGARK